MEGRREVDGEAEVNFSCFVRGTPAPQGSKKAFVVKGRAIVTDANPKTLKDWRSAVNLTLQDRWEGPPIEGPVNVVLNFYLLKPKSVPKKRTRPHVRPDLDKLVRAVLDALTGICFKDDAQVVSMQAEKHYKSEQGVWLTVLEAP